MTRYLCLDTCRVLTLGCMQCEIPRQCPVRQEPHEAPHEIRDAISIPRDIVELPSDEATPCYPQCIRRLWCNLRSLLAVSTKIARSRREELLLQETHVVGRGVVLRVHACVLCARTRVAIQPSKRQRKSIATCRRELKRNRTGWSDARTDRADNMRDRADRGEQRRRGVIGNTNREQALPVESGGGR